MQTIKNLLNKIKWDKNLDPKDFSLFYLDRVSKKLTKIRFKDIQKIEGNFLLIKKGIDGKEKIYIPLHRIREVKQKDKVYWKR